MLNCKAFFRLLLTGLIFSALFINCSGIQKQVPTGDWTGFATPELKRSDYVVLAKAEGVSDTKSVLFGLVKVIENDKMQVLGIKLFEDQYAREPMQEDPMFAILDNIIGDRTKDRAYFKAIAKFPDADCILRRTITTETKGFWPIIETTTVRCSGKAVKIKTDKEL